MRTSLLDDAAHAKVPLEPKADTSTCGKWQRRGTGLKMPVVDATLRSAVQYKEAKLPICHG